MNEFNQKALYYCHTHPNLFLQKKCKSCKRGMCHTCIYNNVDYCQDCLSQQKRFSSNYKDKREISSTLIATLIISTIISILVFYNKYNLPDYSLTESLLIIFFATLTVVSCYYMLRETDLLKSVGKIPFIGFKLILVTGLPILYMIFKITLLIRTNYFKR